jgi:hypothetical protein
MFEQTELDDCFFGVEAGQCGIFLNSIFVPMHSVDYVRVDRTQDADTKKVSRPVRNRGKTSKHPPKDTKDIVSSTKESAA